MDIIDILLSRALTPQGQVGSAVATAQQAAATASQAAEVASNAAEALTSAIEDMESAIDAEVKKMTFDFSSNELSDLNDIYGKSYDLNITYPDATTATIQNIAKLYYTAGENEDGAMTQKAVSENISQINEILTYLLNSINNISAGDFDLDSAGHIVSINDAGKIIPSHVREEDIINLLITTNNYYYPNVAGLEIDYTKKTFKRILDNYDGSTFLGTAPFDGRMRCNVADNGEIIAWEGDNTYKTDGSNGQVMIYQPKFYYKRTPSLLTTNQYGTAIKEEVLQLSDTLKTGYKLHPLFIDENGAELEYALLSAYEGSIEAEDNSYSDVTFTDFLATKLSSVSDAKPISGVNNTLNAINAEKLASNRGYGWHITTSKALSAQQMLMLVEFNSLNVQVSFNDGISRLASGDNNSTKGAQTGATKILGNQTGQASSTSFYYDNNTYTETETGKVSIAYRGYENPWGNMWDYIGDLVIKNNSSTNHTLYICNNYNYSENITNNYTALPFTPPPTTGWISAFAYDTEYDWLFLPIECNSNANSLIPIGDHFFGARTNTGVSTCINGGPWFGEDNNGIFYYTFDRKTTESGGKNVGARLLHIPQATSSIYVNNVVKWNTKMGG